MQKINIAIVTGTRAEFGIFRPVLRAIQASKKLHLQLVVTGMHLQKKFGNTVRDITAEGFKIAAKVPMYKPNDTPAQSLARATAGLAAAFASLKTNLVMVLGDRLEILAAANAALANQLPLAHLHGGETAPGQWDEQIRHAVTKIAHLHFCATKKAAQRIAQMGEDPASIHTVGAPALDSIAIFLSANNIIANRRGSNSLAWKRKAEESPPPSLQPSPLLVLHPSSPDDTREYRRAKNLLRTLMNKFPRNSIHAIGPNNDPGHAGILRLYREVSLRPGPGRIHFTMSLTQSDFWSALSKSSLLIGNSSAGILEAASFGIPVINLGDRQKGRERNPNVIDVPWNAGARGILAAIEKTRSKPFQKTLARRRNLYGDGHAAARIVRILESHIPPISTVKQFHDR